MDDDHLKKLLHEVLDEQPHLQQVRETIYGNGRTGLLTRMSVMETKLEDIDEKLGELCDSWREAVKQSVLQSRTGDDGKTLRTMLWVVGLIVMCFVAGYGLNRISFILPGVQVQQDAGNDEATPAP